MDIIISDEQNEVKVPESLYEVLEQVGIAALKEAGTMDNYEVSVLLASQEEIRSLNARYRKVNEVTDVLSFPLDEEGGEGDEPLFFNETEEIILGDIVICPQRAQEQSLDFGHSFEREMSYLLVHGILHLLGYDHQQEEDRTAMRKMEEQILLKLDLGR